MNKSSSYYLIKKLGEGSFGIVYKAKSENTGKFVAIKEIKNLSDKSILDEIQILKLVSTKCSQYFVCFKEYFYTDKSIYIVTEFLQNYITLSDAIEFHHLDLLQIENFKEITTNLCKGLKLLHSLNVAHKDIKPGNIMVNPNGKIKYIDFGLSCFQSNCKNSEGGSLDYTDPNIIKFIKYKKLNKLDIEILRFFNTDLDLFRQQQGDLWSLGITIYKMITGKKPIDQYYTKKIISLSNGEKTYEIFSDYKKYFNKYNYVNDPNKPIIDKYLKDIKSNINLNKMITRELKEYSCM